MVQLCRLLKHVSQEECDAILHIWPSLSHRSQEALDSFWAMSTGRAADGKVKGMVTMNVFIAYRDGLPAGCMPLAGTTCWL